MKEHPVKFCYDPDCQNAKDNSKRAKQWRKIQHSAEGEEELSEAVKIYESILEEIP